MICPTFSRGGSQLERAGCSLSFFSESLENNSLKKLQENFYEKKSQKTGNKDLTKKFIKKVSSQKCLPKLKFCQKKIVLNPSTSFSLLFSCGG